MALSSFGYVKADGTNNTTLTTAPADGSFKRFHVDPYDLPEWRPYGYSHRSVDGTLIYTGQPGFTVTFNALMYNEQPDGSAGTTGTVLEWANEWWSAQATSYGFMWVGEYDPETGNWNKYLCKPMRASILPKLSGKIVREFTIVCIGVGLNDIGYNGGPIASAIPDPAVVGSSAYGDPYAEGYGWGGYGVGGYGQGGWI